jgi:hypothetical protein
LVSILDLLREGKEGEARGNEQQHGEEWKGVHKLAG